MYNATGDKLAEKLRLVWPVLFAFRSVNWNLIVILSAYPSKKVNLVQGDTHGYRNN